VPVADGFADAAVASADGVREVFLADGFADAVVALPEEVGDPVAGVTLAEVPTTGVAAACLASASWSGRSTTTKEATTSAAAADMNSHRLYIGPP
jgi:hypothetical protein